MSSEESRISVKDRVMTSVDKSDDGVGLFSSRGCGQVYLHTVWTSINSIVEL